MVQAQRSNEHRHQHHRAEEGDEPVARVERDAADEDVVSRTQVAAGGLRSRRPPRPVQMPEEVVEDRCLDRQRRPDQVVQAETVDERPGDQKPHADSERGDHVEPKETYAHDSPPPASSGRPGDRLLPVERPRVPRRRHEEEQRHADRGTHAADVEQEEAMPGNAHLRVVEEGNRADGHQDSKLGRTEPEEAHLERLQGRRGEVHLDRQQVVGHQDRGGDQRRHVARQAEARDDHEGADRVEDVVDVEPVARPLAVADPGDGAVEAVAEPVDRQEHDDEPERGRIAGRKPVAGAGPKHGQAAQHGQVVRIDPGRQSSGDIDEQPLLGGGKHAGLLSNGVAIGGWLTLDPPSEC